MGFLYIFQAEPHDITGKYYNGRELFAHLIVKFIFNT